MTGNRKRIIAGALALPVIAALALFGYVLAVTKGDNFHAITEGEAYRSAQLDAERLAFYVRRHDIRSVINLRDEHPGEAWYDREIETCRRLGVKHFDIRMRSDRQPSGDTVDHLLWVFEHAPRPVLIHCRSGADRTGLAASLWKLAIDGEPRAAAAKQLSLYYGHLPFGERTEMDRFFEEWQPRQRDAAGEGQLEPAHAR